MSAAVAVLSRRYHFAASHRLHTERMDADGNQAAFGKCNNPHGHGHNYVVEVAFAGGIDAETGMVTNLADLDGFARTALLDVFDHQNLNTMECFQDLVPTTENLAVEVHRIFAGYPLARLVGVHVDETVNNSFDYAGGGYAGGGDRSAIRQKERR